MNKLSVCPDIRDYQDLASGQLPPETKESLLRHLEGCDSCVRKLQTLPAQDSLIACIQQIKTPSGEPQEKQLAPLIQRLIQLRQAGAAPKARTFAFACPGCGKSLRVREEAAGKKVKCPQCGQVAQTPAAERPEGAAETPPAAQETGVFTPADAGASAPITKAGIASAADLNRSSEDTQFHASSKDQKLCSFLAPAQAADELGRLGPYRVLKVLGAGGMGVVFRAEDPQLQRLVALKAMLPDLAANESARQRFLREARAAAKLKHDHIVTIFQVGEDRGAPFLAMEFLEGESLDDRIKREDKIPLAEIIRIGREIAEGLEAAHEHGLIHRDIKPGNVWLEGKRGRVKILDFGLARSAKDDVHLTQSGAIVGTPAYMPPEQARGEAVDGRCDLYSLGCVLYRLCTGQLPFKGENTMSLLLALATEQPKSVRELNADVPPALADLIMRLLAKDAAQRPATAREVADALNAIDTGEPVVVKVARAPAPPRRRRRFAVAVASGALLLVVMLTVIVIRLGKPEEGIVTIETVDPDVELVFTSGGRDFKVHDKKTGEKIKLPLGIYQVKLKDGKEGLTLNTNQFTLMTRGDRALVKVMWKAGDQPKSARADITAPVQVAEPPPLAEWLKGRKVLTVAQDGSAQFKTIQEALKALQPGQVVKVLDRGPYRERLALDLPDDCGLVSEQMTVLELSEWKPGWKDSLVGHFWLAARGFRLNGFVLAWPKKADGMGFTIHQADGFVLENCLIRCSSPDKWGVAVHISWSKEAEARPVHVRECVFEGMLAVNSANGLAEVVIERNYFVGEGNAQHVSFAQDQYRRVVIRENVFSGRPADFEVIFQAAKEIRELEISNNTTLSGVPLGFMLVPLKGSVRIRNNLRFRPGLVVMESGAETGMPQAVKNWHVGNNAYPRQLAEPERRLEEKNIFPQTPTDIVTAARFLSDDPADREYLRLATDSSQAKGGAGGAWPSYIGALPPGPAPKDGDWFTRLREKWLRDKPAAGK